MPISKFFVALQAAQADQGVAVGWHRQARTLVQDGKLVRITDLKLDVRGGYYLMWNDNRPLSPAAERLRDLVAEDLDRRAERLRLELAPQRAFAYPGGIAVRRSGIAGLG
ncbi:LysR substrate-binding domain-containing protein [Mesorhizobium sp. M0977]|uniref:LysR substrate-binding domain-containing protein n=1 Tax=Mesorhizobium sp. M0977 TaxID=2957039 RepID=UPI003339115F